MDVLTSKVVLKWVCFTDISCFIILSVYNYAIENILFFIRLQDIEDLKVAAKKMLRQVVHSLYQALVMKATQVLKEIEVRMYCAIC